MTQGVNIGELHSPGAGREHNSRTFILTAPVAGDSGTEVIFGLFTGDAPKKILDKLCDRLAEELRPAFFRPSVEIDARYEAALKQSNKLVLGFLHEHGLSIPGIKLSGAIGALSGNRLLISGRGGLRGLLAMRRDSRPKDKPAAEPGGLSVFNLFDATSDHLANPKFFFSLQAGTVKPGARLVVANTELFEALDEAYVKRVVGAEDFARSMKELKNSLRSSPLTVSLMTLTVPEEPFSAAAEVRAPAPAKPPAPPPRKPREENLPVSLDPGELAVRGIKGASRAAGGFLKRLPGLAAGGISAAAASVGRLIRPAAKEDGAADLSHKEAVASLAHFPGQMVAVSTRPVPIGPPSKLKLALIAGAAAVVIGGGALYWHARSVSAEDKAVEAKLTELQQLQTDLETSLIYGNSERSGQIYVRMKQLVELLPSDTKGHRQAAKDASAELEKAGAKLRREVVIDRPTVFADLSAAGNDFLNGSLVWFKGGIYLFSNAVPSVIAVGSDGTAAKPQMISGPAGGIARAVSYSQGIVLVGADGQAWTWNPASSSASPLAGATFDSAQPVLSYQDRLYYQTGNGSVVRRSVVKGQLSSPAVAVKAGTLPASVTDFAADGSIYFLESGGKVEKLFRGRPLADFNPQPIEPAPRNVSIIRASTTSSRLVLADTTADRLVYLDKNSGDLVGQVLSPEFKGLKGVALDDSSGSLFVLSGRKIYRLSLELPKVR